MLSGVKKRRSMGTKLYRTPPVAVFEQRIIGFL